MNEAKNTSNDGDAVDNVDWKKINLYFDTFSKLLWQ